MDLATLVGLLGASGIVTYSMISGGDIGMFGNAPSLLIVLVGTRVHGANEVHSRAVYRRDKG